MAVTRPNGAKRPRGAKPRVKKEERMAQLLDAAEAAFAAQPYAAVRVEDIAAACGVTKPLIYSLYGSKQALFAQVLDRAADRVSAAVIAVGAAIGDDAALDAALGDLMAVTQEIGGLLNFEPGAALTDPKFLRAVQVRQARVQDEFLSVVTKLYPTTLPEAHARAIAEPYVAALLGAAEGGGQWWARNPKVPADETRRLSRRVLGAMLALIAEDLAKAEG